MFFSPLSRTGTEVLSKTLRVMFTTLGAFLFYGIGYMILPWIAYSIREWRTLLAVLAATSVVYIPLWWYATVVAQETSGIFKSRIVIVRLQVHPGVPPVADHAGKSGGGRSHCQRRCTEEQS